MAPNPSNGLGRVPRWQTDWPHYGHKCGTISTAKLFRPIYRRKPHFTNQWTKKMALNNK